MTANFTNVTTTDGSGRPRRVFLLGCPRSRTSVSQTVVSLSCHLATMKSTNWYLGHPMTVILNGQIGTSRQDARPPSIKRVRDHVRDVTGVDLPDGFRLEEALDLLATETGAAGWLEKTPINVLTIPEIEADIPDAHFVHLVRDPVGVITSLIRRTRQNPDMFGAAHQSVQSNDEALWRACIEATLAQHGKPRHIVVSSESFVDAPEVQAQRIAAFLDVPYLPPDDPRRVAAAAAMKPSERAWKKDAVGPVRRIEHAEDIELAPLEPATVQLWEQARHEFGITT
ncbi:sulfotransferase family protein [Kineosporia babensis]|uniref:Sulfotransferase n=1 Tax=Kineosporia babensis TaxID=499548 RepID=A0A9X1NM69_9ACTN|nr:sulfotransferase [Kineosporia babensis]MCD5316129.1 sulfotransferase [Kineosporia babensis]